MPIENFENYSLKNAMLCERERERERNQIYIRIRKSMKLNSHV